MYTFEIFCFTFLASFTMDFALTSFPRNFPRSSSVVSFILVSLNEQINREVGIPGARRVLMKLQLLTEVFKFWLDIVACLASGVISRLRFFVHPHALSPWFLRLEKLVICFLNTILCQFAENGREHSKLSCCGTKKIQDRIMDCCTKFCFCFSHPQKFGVKFSFRTKCTYNEWHTAYTTSPDRC